MVVCKDRLEKLSAGDRARKMAGTISTAHVAVESEIAGLLSGKSYDQLSALQRQIQEKLSSGEPVDIEYWESLLKSLIVWKAKVSHHYTSNPDYLLTCIQVQAEESARSCGPQSTRATQEASTR